MAGPNLRPVHPQTPPPAPAVAARSLPIYQHEAEIVAAVRDHPVVVLEGPTGSGKTTQLPRILLHAGLVEGVIGITQPRRIAAVSVAHRIALEEGVAVGDEVGYAIRFDDRTGPATRVKIMTDGILLQEVRSDPDLSAYGVLVVDEAHERSLNIDFCLGLLYRLLERRRDLRVVISSATIRPESFQAFFGGVSSPVPRISVKSRVHPIRVEYRPVVGGGAGDELAEAAAREVVTTHRRGDPGHVLVFLTGEAMIHATAQAIEHWRPGRGLAVLPLYGRLPREEQERVFESFGDRRKAVLATNIAETSITIPDVRFVVDTGLAKIPRFNAQTGITSLREEPISRASAEQRAGRAGRTAPGTVVRLYKRSDFERKPEFTEEEIRRLDLSEVVLRLIDLGVPEVETFPFPTPPPGGKVLAALETLQAMNAIDSRRRLTEIGRRMVPFPMAPSLSRMVVEAADQFGDVVDEVIAAGAFMSGRPPYLFPAGEEDAARKAQARFAHPLGDAITAIRVYRAWRRSRDREGFCRRNYLDPDILAFIESAHEQLSEIAAEHGIEVRGGGEPERVVRCLATGLADKLLRRRRGGQYETAQGSKVSIHPGSSLFGTRHAFLVAAELVVSTRTWARNVSVMKPQWIAEISPELARAWRIKGRRQKRRAAESPPPTSVELAGVSLQVSHRKGKVTVDVPGWAVERLEGADPSEVDAKVLKWPARIVTEQGVFAAGTPFGRLLALLPDIPLPRPGESLRKDVPEGTLLNVDENWPTIERLLDRVLSPALPNRGRRPGWVTLVANGLGEFWFEVVHDYLSAVQSTVLSLEDLVRAVGSAHPAREKLDRQKRRLERVLEP